MKAKDIMITDVPLVSPDTPLVEAVRTLKNNFGDESYQNAAPGLVVVNERGVLAGILSPLTIIKALLDVSQADSARTERGTYDDLCAAIKDQRVGDVMDWQPISITEDADLLDVADLFVKHRFQRIPVVKEQRVVGIIYRSRLLFAMTGCFFD